MTPARPRVRAARSTLGPLPRLCPYSTMSSGVRLYLEDAGSREVSAHRPCDQTLLQEDQVLLQIGIGTAVLLPREGIRMMLFAADMPWQRCERTSCLLPPQQYAGCRPHTLVVKLSKRPEHPHQSPSFPGPQICIRVQAGILTGLCSSVVYTASMSAMLAATDGCPSLQP